MDAHAKNFSLLYDTMGPRLAPFYDVVSTLVYPSLTPAYAMYIGNASRPHQLGPHALERFARELAVTPATVREAVDEVTSALETAWPTVLDAAIQVTGDATIYNQMERVVRRERERIRQAAVKPSAAR